MKNYMHYTYGVSSNCQADDYSFQVGDGEYGIPTINYVGNDLDKIEKELTKTLTNDAASALMRAAANCSLDGMFARRDHNYVGNSVNAGGEVVSVILCQHGHVHYVIFDFPTLPAEIV